jgi:PAS domain S-box-containing protein
VKLSLSLKISITVISLISVGGAATAYLVYTRSANSLTDSISSIQLQLTRQSMDKIDRFLYERTVDVQELTDRELLQRYLSRPAGRTADSSTQLIKQLNHYRVLGGAWENLSLVDAEGVAVLSTGNQASITALGQRAEFKEAYNKAVAGETSYTDLFAQDTDSSPIILFMAPVHDLQDPAQPITGVVVGELAWQAALETMRTIQNSQAILLNKQGVHIGENASRGGDEILKESHADSAAFKQAQHGQGTQILPGVEEHKAEKGKEGESFVTSYIRESGYLDYRGSGWTLILQTPVSEALAPVAALRSTVVLIFALTAMLTAGLALLFARRFTRPIVVLTKQAREISSGNLQQRVPVSSHDEVGTLAQAFNVMTDRLADSYAALEQKVVERTQQLQVKVAELAAAKAKDEAILTNMGEGMVVTDNSHHLVLANPAAASLLEINPGEHIGDDFLKVAKLTEVEIKEDDEPGASESPGAADSNSQHTSTTYTLARKDGRTATIVIMTTAIIQNGENIGAINLIRDITREKEVDRMKTEFISLASHQLRTPLSAIRWFSEMLINGDAGELNPEQKEFATNVSDSASRMIQLVNSLLNISRIESGRIIIDPKPTDLNELVAGVVNDLQAKTKEREQNLIVSIHQGLPKVNLDVRLIGQVYMNLLTNAIKYTPKGGDISVFVSRKGDQLVSQITDNGYGIPKAEQAKMFQKFFRATNVAKVETDGTGLGLYLIKAVVESSGGKIWFESEEGKGTTFWFSLPMSGMLAKEGEVTLD